MNILFRHCIPKHFIDIIAYFCYNIAMIDHEYDAMRKHHCETLVREHFHLYLPVDELLFDDIETGPSSYAVLFRSGHHIYSLFVSYADNQTLGDVKSIMNHMGITPSKILPPHADPYYFTREAKKHAARLYPAIKSLNPSTVAAYQSRAPYAPGLVRVGEISSYIKRYTPGTSQWQHAFDYTFRKVKVS